MNWYKKAQIDINGQLSLLDTRTRADTLKANDLILKTLNIQIGDILRSKAGMSSGPDKNYEVKSINPNLSVNLLALETNRPMPNVNLFNPIKKNQPAWEKA